MSKDFSLIKLRFLTLVVVTANFINERATSPLNYTHSLIAPTALFTSVIFLSTMIIGDLRGCRTSKFLQCYALVMAAFIYTCLVLLVFKLLTRKKLSTSAEVLNGLLPMFVVLLLLLDLVKLMFLSRDLLPPAAPQIWWCGGPQIWIKMFF